MRHRKGGRKFGMDSSARKAMFRNMVTSLMLHGQIRTTEARAKELRHHAERLITISKRAPSLADLEGLSGDDLARAKAHRVAAIRRIRQVVMDGDVVQRIMGDYAERYRTRPGGYTRVVKLTRPRPGDNARMAVIQLVTEPCVPKPKKQTDAPAAEAAPVAEETVEATASVELPADEDEMPTESFETEPPAEDVGVAELVEEDEDTPKE